MDNPVSLIEAHQQRVDKMNGELAFPPNGMSIDLLRAVYRSNSIPLPVRMRAAIAALPHETPRLQVSALVSEQGFAELLDKRLKRIAQMEAMNGKPQTQVIEAKPQPEVEVKAPLPRSNDRRYRRF
jgi:hypothetical protein